ncbi:hypothetical protein T09_9890 [Trichinella sp. T9]|nr:hypothetical protein T09_9890 [Trichinella sp. T9]
MKAKTVVHKVEVQRAKLHGMVDQLIQLCENASHPDNIRKPLEEVMVFRDTAGIHTHKGFRVPAEQREPRSDSCSAISKDLNLRSSSKPEMNGNLLELRMPQRAQIHNVLGPFPGKCSSSEELGRLLEIRELAFESIRCLMKKIMPSSGVNYPHVVELLKTRFGSTDVIVQKHVKALWDVNFALTQGTVFMLR